MGVRLGAGWQSPAAMPRRWLAGLFAVSALFAALVAIFVTSILATSLGLGLGRMIGTRVGGATGLVAGVLLVLTGIVFAIARTRGL